MENKRITSTIFLIICLAVVIFLCWVAVDLLVGIKNYSPDTGALGDTEGETQLMAGIWAGVALIAPVLLIFLVSGIIILISLICLGFSIRNTRVKNKPVRIINIVLSCCFASASALAVIVLILLKVL